MMRCLLTLGCLLTTSLAGSAATTFTTTHESGDSGWWFVLPAPPAEAFYTEVPVAIMIEEVHADGVALVASPHESTRVSHLEFETLSPPLSSYFVYRMAAAQFVVIDSRTIRGCTLKEYTVPLDATRIEIVYRIRYPGGRVSQPLTLISFAADELPKGTQNEPSAVEPPPQSQSGTSPQA